MVTLVDKIDHDNLFISKAASQCVLSMCKMEGIKIMVKKMAEDTIRKLKRYLEDVIQKLPADNFSVTPNDLNAILEERFKVDGTVNRSESIKKKSVEPNMEMEKEDKKEIMMKNNSNHRRLEKIKRSIKGEERKMENKEMIGGKLFSFVTGEGSLKERT